MKEKQLKKAIRAQQARMGGSYSAARLVVIGEPPSGSGPADSSPAQPLEEWIKALLPLAIAAFDKEPGQATSPTTLAPRDGELALVQALRHIPVHDLYRTETVMYAGRDLGDGAQVGRYYELHETLRRDEPGVTISMMTEKSPLAQYLARGLLLAQRVGISLEQLSALEPPIPRESRPTPPRVESERPRAAEFDRGAFRVAANMAWLAGLRRALRGHDILSRTWTNLDEMVEVLEAVGAPNSNHMFFPRGGGKDLSGARRSHEAGCLDLFCSPDRIRPEIVRPQSLTMNTVAACPSMSYLRLDLNDLQPSGIYEQVPTTHEELTETNPGRYADRALWEDGDHEPSWRLVTRWMKGAFVIFSKGSLYNAFGDYWKGDTYDGRHSKMSGSAFREHVDRMVADAITRGLPTT